MRIHQEDRYDSVEVHRPCSGMTLHQTESSAQTEIFTCVNTIQFREGFLWFLSLASKKGTTKPILQFLQDILHHTAPQIRTAESHTYQNSIRRQITIHSKRSEESDESYSAPYVNRPCPTYDTSSYSLRHAGSTMHRKRRSTVPVLAMC
jgi:hypothetical protein